MHISSYTIIENMIKVLLAKTYHHIHILDNFSTFVLCIETTLSMRAGEEELRNHPY